MALLLFLFTVLLTIPLCACTPSAPESPPASPILSVDQLTGISGRVVDLNGQPTADAYVYAYRNQRTNLRGPADFEARTDTAGNYFLDVSAGEYYLVVRMRKEGGNTGPPHPGDAWGLPATNPVKVENSHPTRVDFRLQSVMKSPVMREGTLTSGTTGFTGRLVDYKGKPAAGAFVLAYRNNDFHRMPDFISPPSSADGRFTLYLPEPGSYCLAARTETRGRPVADEPYGVLNSGECPQAETGQILEVGTISLKPYRR